MKIVIVNSLIRNKRTQKLPIWREHVGQEQETKKTGAGVHPCLFMLVASDNSLLKTIGSHSDTILRHMSYLDDPTIKYKNWDKLLPEYRTNVLANWNKEIRALSEQIEIAMDILINRR